MQDVLEERRKITDPDICNIFNLGYLRNHVDDIQKEMREGFRRMDARFEKMEQRISLVFTFLGIGFTILAALITLFQFMA